MPIHCDIVSQDRSLFSGDADMIIAPGSEGLLTDYENATRQIRHRFDRIFDAEGARG